MAQTIKIGDRIQFRAITRWSGVATWRKVNGFDSRGWPTVVFGGWRDFIVRPHEVLQVEQAA